MTTWTPSPDGHMTMDCWERSLSASIRKASATPGNVGCEVLTLSVFEPLRAPAV